jgi:hypothetical protein
MTLTIERSQMTTFNSPTNPWFKERGEMEGRTHLSAESLTMKQILESNVFISQGRNSGGEVHAKRNTKLTHF